MPPPGLAQPASAASSARAGRLQGPAASIHDLRTLVLSRHPAISLETAEEDRADMLVRAVAADLSVPVYEWTVTRGLAAADGQGGIYDTSDPRKMLATIVDIRTDALFVLKDFAGHLADPAISRQFRELLAWLGTTQATSTLILVGATVELAPDVSPHVVPFDLRPPSHDEYRAMVQAVAQSFAANGRAQVSLGESDVDDLARAVTGLTLNQARQAVARVAIEDGHLTRDDVASLIDLKASALREQGLLEYFPAADNPTEIGGFGGLRRWLDRARLALTPEAAELNLPAPRGVLLVGVQGCGKSLAAKYIARSWEMPLLKLDAGRLYDKFVGETERNLRKAIATAESLAPVVLWMDEIEKALAPSGGDDGGVSRRMFGSFLTWMQEKNAQVFVVATANDLSVLPPELLRKGRFDEIFFVDLPDAGERAEILRIHLALRRQDPAAFDLAGLAAASDGYSGAELEQVVITAILQSLHSQQPLGTAGLHTELVATVPLSRSRHEDIAALRDYASGRFVPVR